MNFMLLAFVNNYLNRRHLIDELREGGKPGVLGLERSGVSRQRRGNGPPGWGGGRAALPADTS